LNLQQAGWIKEIKNKCLQEAMEMMPKMVFGTMEYVDGREQSAEWLGEATLAALEAGYRHLDCAELYESTPFVAKAIAACELPREEMWITSKVKGLPTGEYEAVKERVGAHIDALGVGSLDLLLVHWPGKSLIRLFRS